MAANSNLWPPEIQNLEMHLGIAKGITTHRRVICMHENLNSTWLRNVLQNAVMLKMDEKC